SFHYAEGSGRISLGSGLETPVEPSINGSELQFHLPEIPAGATARLLYRVRIGANAAEGDQVNTAIAVGVFPSGEKTTSARARAIVRVSAGVFSTRQAIVGRVFVDTNGNQEFDDQDRPMPGVRLYLTNGQSVITDSAGLYNFPSLGDGPQVISLDPVSVPPGYKLTDGGRESGKGWTRLLRTPIGGGALLRQNFILKKLATSSTTEVSKPQIAPPVQPVPSASADASNRQTEKGPGTYEIASTETIAAVPPGEVQIISPAPDSVSMTPGAQVEVRTAIDWTARLEVNGEQVSEKNIGV